MSVITTGNETSYNCILCNSNEFEKLAQEGEYEYIECKKCGLMSVNPLPTNEELSKFYDKYHSIPEYINAPDKLSIKFSIYEKEFNVFLKYLSFLTTPEIIGSKAAILDVGCGLGDFLLVAKRKGIKSMGIEVAKDAANYVSKKLGVDTFIGTLKEANLPSDYFDGVNLSHMLEHCLNPVQTLNEVNRILKQKGVIRIELPNPNSFINILTNMYHRVTGRYKRDKYSCALFPPEHIYVFPYKTLILLMRKTHFKILKINCAQNKFSFLFMVLEMFIKRDRGFACFLVTNMNNVLKDIFLTVIDFLGDKLFKKGDVLYIYARKVE